jgi:hypothetical protein
MHRESGYFTVLDKVMKRFVIVLSLSVCVLLLSCEGRHASHVNSNIEADTPGSGAKILKPRGQDSTIIDSNNYGPPKN